MQIENAFRQLKPSQREEYFPDGLPQARKLVEGIQQMTGEELSCEQILDLYIYVNDISNLFGSVDSRSRRNIANRFSIAPENVDMVIAACQEAYQGEPAPKKKKRAPEYVEPPDYDEEGDYQNLQVQAPRKKSNGVILFLVLLLLLLAMAAGFVLFILPKFRETTKPVPTETPQPTEEPIRFTCSSCGKAMTPYELYHFDLQNGSILLCYDCYSELTEKLTPALPENEEFFTESDETEKLTENWDLDITEENSESAAMEETPQQLPVEWLNLKEFDLYSTVSLMIDFPADQPSGTMDDPNSIGKVAYFPELQILAVTLTRNPIELNLFTGVPESTYWNFCDAASPYAYYWNRIYNVYQREAVRLDDAVALEDAMP